MAEAATQLGQDGGTGDQGAGGGEDWRGSLPDDLQGLTTIQDIGTLADLVKSYDSAQRMIGSSVRIPSQEAGPEDWEAFHAKLKDIPGITRITDETRDDVFNKLGRPETPDGYDAELPAELRAEFHKLGLTKQQAEAVVERFGKDQAERETAIRAEIEQGMEQLKADWGRAFEKNIGLARNVVRMYDELTGGTELRDFLNSSKLGDHPALIKAFAKIGELFGEARTLKGHSEFSNRFDITPEEARMRAEEIMRNREDAYWKGDETRVREVSRLMEIANGG